LVAATKGTRKGSLKAIRYAAAVETLIVFVVDGNGSL